MKKILFIVVLSVSLQSCTWFHKKPLIHPDLLTVEMTPLPEDIEYFNVQQAVVVLNTAMREFCKAIEKLDQAVFYSTDGKIRIKFPEAYNTRCK